MASKDYRPESDNESAKLAPGQFLQLRFYKNGELRVDFDPRIDKLPEGQAPMMQMLGSVTAALMEVTAWTTRSLKIQETLHLQMKKAFEKMETGGEVQ